MQDRQLLLFGIPTVSVLMLLPEADYALQSVTAFLVSWPISLVYTLTIWLGTRAIWQWLIRRFPAVGQTSVRLWWLAAACLLYASLATVAITVGLTLVLPTEIFGVLSAERTFVQVLINLVPTSVVLLVYESQHFFQKWEQNVRRAEQLTQASVQSQLEALQNQLDPHFLFNSLNTLSALIEPGNVAAQEFVEQLADVYRYVLLSRDKVTVPLAEELAFVDTYVALQKVRFRDNLRVEQHVPSEALEWHVAPLSVQLLVENALKHNVASRENPLELCLTADPATGYFTVENVLRPRLAGLASGTGTGLRNVQHRYELLHAPQPVEISTANQWFRVRLPLLEPR
ncbi:signal transduction histidine kinase, LytS [Hymenobacter roseosalivarius DSM 11622]|uniref:Signal transduction histidine kinase, LytS n=1 Tax=Hymenobacter roseosalivarius DSM 11622 TaxID=645990 RepID=A0A1W1VX56_9BACT|nr:histidine kinase [Hymenobacter roseosalivarius]SMB97962.1 signal transduction histidine kinase, LytS [Hymenobacter roseosalivarius DSM 11622]